MDLSIIILNYNTFKFTSECVDSINQTTKDLKFEIIIVDNASHPEELKKLEQSLKTHKNVKLIKNNKNTGFAAGNNLGLRYAKGEYILLLNSDTKILDNCIYEMIQWIKANKKAGVVSCGLLNPDKSVQRNGGYFPNLWRVATWMLFIEDLPIIGSAFQTFHPKPAKVARQQDWVTGAFMLIPKKALDKVGLMPEDYFMYTEDVDYCYQFKQNNWEVWYLPQWAVIHFGGVSSKPGEGLVKEFTSLKIFIKKHYPRWQYPFFIFLLKAGAMLRMLIFGILKGSRAANIYAKILREV